MKSNTGYITDKEFNECIKHLRIITDYAYENGFHELGYDPVSKIQSAYTHLSADYDQALDQYRWLKEDFDEEVKNSAKHVHCEQCREKIEELKSEIEELEDKFGLDYDVL